MSSDCKICALSHDIQYCIKHCDSELNLTNKFIDNLKVIDFERKGNVIRFYLGLPGCTDYCGDGWDDAPYNCNAESVYEEYVIATYDIVFPFDYSIWEPADQNYEHYSKNDLKDRSCPCIVAYKRCSDDELPSLVDLDVNIEGLIKIYFEDTLKDLKLINREVLVNER